MSHRDEHLDLCAAEALGVLTPSERRELELHLAEGCLECERARREFAGGTTVLGASAPQVAPPPILKNRVLMAARAHRKEEKAQADRAEYARHKKKDEEPAPAWKLPARVREPRSFAGTWGLAAAALILLAITMAFRFSREAALQVKLREERIAELEGTLNETLVKLGEEQRWTAVLASEGGRCGSFAPTPDNKLGVAGRYVYDPATKRAVIVLEKAGVPTDKDYELWAITPQGPASLGIAKAGADGVAVARIENVPDAASLKAFAVSLEASGGSPSKTAPAGPVVAVAGM
ncbi:MAG: anti-sigma factor [Bdellovibrionota bacterium]